MTTLPAGRSARLPPRAAARAAVAVVAGLGVGAVTSLLQARLNSPWQALVNSASPWLAASFAVGAVQLRCRSAAAAGLLTCAGEVTGYYFTAAIRGYPAGPAFLAFWAACAVAGGPLFGAAGWLWRNGTPRTRGLGAAVLPAAFLAEGLIAYGLRLHYLSSAVLFTVLGLATAAGLGLPGHRVGSLARWLLPVLAAAALAELALGLIGGQALARL